MEADTFFFILFLLVVFINELINLFWGAGRWSKDGPTNPLAVYEYGARLCCGPN